MERVNLRAVVGVRVTIGVNARAVIGGSVPGVAVIGGHHRVRVYGVVDGEEEGDSGVAAVDGLEMLDIGSGLRIEGVVPGEGLAGGAVPDGGGVVPECEAECDDGVAAAGSREGLRVVA